MRNSVVSTIIILCFIVIQMVLMKFVNINYQLFILGIIVVSMVCGFNYGLISLAIFSIVMVNYSNNDAIECILFYSISIMVMYIIRKKNIQNNLLESIPQIIWTANKYGRGIYCNKQWENYTGMHLKQNWETHMWTGPIHPDDVERVVNAWLQAINSSEETFEIRYRLRSKQNEYRWHLGKGKFMNGIWGGTVTDIHNEVVSQELIIQQKNQKIYQAIGESINYGIWICNPDGKNTYASQSFLDLVGITQEQCSEFGWGDVLHPDDAENTIAAWQECVASNKSLWDREHRFKGKDGQWHHVLARGVPVYDNGVISCWAGINLDISHLKSVESELRQLNSTLEERVEEKP